MFIGFVDPEPIPACETLITEPALEGGSQGILLALIEALFVLSCDLWKALLMLEGALWQLGWIKKARVWLLIFVFFIRKTLRTRVIEVIRA